MGKISADGFKRRFALACRPQGTWKDEINRLFVEQQINPRTFCDDTELDETMYYRLKSKDEPPNLIALAGYTCSRATGSTGSTPTSSRTVRT